MTITAGARAARFRASRASLHLGVALVAVLGAFPSYAQTAAAAQTSDAQVENASLRKENELLRQQLAALQHPQAASAALSAPPAASGSGGGGTNGDGGGVRASSAPSDIVITGQAPTGGVAALTDLKDVPKAVAVVTPAELKAFDQVSLPDALSRLGNVRWNDGNPRTGSFSMRGLTASPGSDTIDPSIGITVDGVAFQNQSLVDLVDNVDIEQINVTKGPQGTLGARPTSVGQINIITRRPSFTPDASATVTYGENDALRTEFEGGGPIVDNLLAFRVTATRDTRLGDWINTYRPLTGFQTYPSVDRTYARVQFLITPTPNLSIRLKGEYSPKGGEYINGLSFGKPTPVRYGDRGGTPRGLVDATNDPVNPNPYNQNPLGTTALDKLSRSWFKQQTSYRPLTDYYTYNPQLNASLPITTGGHGGMADIEWRLGKHSISWLVSTNRNYFLAGNDDGTPFDITSNGGFITTYQQLTSELKATGSILNDKVDYTAGLYYLRSNADSLSRTLYGSDAGAYNASGAQWTTLSANATGLLLLQNALNKLYTGTQSYLHNYEKAAFLQLDGHVTDKLTLTAGGRIQREKRTLTQGALVLDEGNGASLDPVFAGATTLGGAPSSAILAQNLAQQYLGQSYASLTPSQQTQFTNQAAAAQALRKAQLGNLYPLTVATPYIGTLYTGQLSARYDFSDAFTAFATLSYGQKPGAPGFNGLLPAANATTPNPGPRNWQVLKERTLDAELGVRANLLNDTLVVNADVFRADIWNFQQTIYQFDAYLTSIATNGQPVYTSGPGNVPKVRTQGLEAQIDYSGIENLNIRFSGAYTDAKYVSYPTAGQPSENGDLATKYRDLSGFTLPNAPKFQFNLAGTYRRPIGETLQAHLSLGVTYTSKQNGDTALSSYGWQHAYALTDLSLGIGRQDKLFDVNLIVRNLFDISREDQGWSTITVYQKPRWIGVSLSSKFL